MDRSLEQKVAVSEKNNLKEILEIEKKEKEKMGVFARLIRKIKNLFVRSHDFKDNGIIYKNDNNFRPKIVVYTCITGGYDKIQEPIFEFDNVDYVAFSDHNLKSKKWKVKQIPKEYVHDSTVLTNRFLKMHPHLLFKDKYDFAIYIDGNIKIFGDVTPLTGDVGRVGLAMHRHSMRDDIRKEILACIAQKKGNVKKMREQLKRYKKEGFPKKYGMLECNVIVSNLKNEKAKNLLDDWWTEFVNSGSMRDQLSLPFVAWKNGYKIDDFGNLGYNIYRNPIFRKVEHKK